MGSRLKIAIVGASGVVGRNLIPRLVEAGHRVRAGVRRRGSAVVLDGVEEVEADIFDRMSLIKLASGMDAIINVASSIPRANGDGGSFAAYDRIRLEGTRNVIGACDATRVVLIAQSIALLHCTDQASPQIEQSPVVATGVWSAALDLEKIVGAWRGDYRIVRGGALYGPGTSTDDDWFDRYGRGELRAPGDGSTWVSPIHVADLAAAFQTVLERGSPRSAWIAADDEPMSHGAVYGVVAHLSRYAHGPPKEGGEPGLPSFRVANAALRGLGWCPRYRSVRSGLIGAAERHRRDAPKRRGEARAEAERWGSRQP